MKVELQNSLSYKESNNNKVTKREHPKIIGSLYDPIGILNPFTLTARILMQDIWKFGLEWENESNEGMHKQYAN